MQTKVVQNQKTTKRLSIFITGCMFHPEKATSTCYLENYRLLRLDYEDKICLDSKTAEKNFFLEGCTSHPEIATLSGHLKKFCF